MTRFCSGLSPTATSTTEPYRPSRSNKDERSECPYRATSGTQNFPHFDFFCRDAENDQYPDIHYPPP
jgi:hypothetical protein